MAAPAPFSRDGKDFYLTPNGQMTTVEAGFDTSNDYPDWMPATKDDVDARDYERAQARIAPGPSLRDAGGDIDPDAVFPQTTLNPAVRASPYSDETLDPAIKEEAADVAAFNALPEPVPPEEAPVAPFSRDGKDFYVDDDGTMHTVEAGFDTSEEYPDWMPATAEQVHARDIQKRSGSFRDQLRTLPEAALAEGATLISGVHKAIVDPRYNPNPKSAYIQPEEIAPGVFTPEAKERREANPTATVFGAMAPDLLISALAPELGPEVIGRSAARLMAQGMLAEASDAVITGDEFSMSDALAVWSPVNFAFEAATPPALRAAGQALGWVKKAPRRALDWAAERARNKGAAEAVRETDPIKRAALLRKPAIAQKIYEDTQAALDEALDAIDQKTADAPERLFKPSALKTTVSKNAEAQKEAASEMAARLGRAAEVTENDTVREAFEIVEESISQSGPTQYGALRQAWRTLTDEQIDSNLVREALEGLEKTLADDTVWGRAAKHHAGLAADVAETSAQAGGKASVRDLAAREALERRLERARGIASLSGDKALSKEVAKAEAALKSADEVTGARAMSGALPDEVDGLRKFLDGFPERQPKLTEDLHAALEKLDLPETWTLERVEAHLAERMAGSKAGRKTLDDMLADVEKAIGKREKGTARAAAEATLNRARKLAAEADEFADAFRRVRDFEAEPTGWRKYAHRAIDKATGRVASAVVGRGSAALLGHAAFGPVGAVVGAISESVVDPYVQATAKRAGDYLKGLLKKHGRTALGVGALYGASRLANDESDASPNAAAAVSVFGLPLFFMKGSAKGVNMAKALKDLDQYATEYGIRESHHLRDAAVHLYGRDGLSVYDAMRVVDRHSIDLGAKDAVAQIAKVLESDVSYRYAQNHINDVLARNPELSSQLAAKAEAKANKAAATRAAKESRRVEEGAAARNLLGQFGEWLDKGLKQKGGTYTIDRAKRMLARKAPLKVDEIEWEARHFQSGNEELQKPVLAALRQNIDERVAALGPDALLADRVQVEDEYLRDILGSALGRPPSKRKPRALDPGTDAKSRYYARKKDFDTWRRRALPDHEREATIEWQTMGYRILNADIRDGDVAKHAAVAEAIDKHFMTPREAMRLGDEAREITKDLMAALNTAVERGQTVPGLVRRGIAITEDEVERLLTAKTVTAQGFMSTSIHTGTPREFAKRRAKEFGLVPVDIQIEQRTGVPLGQGEGEVTLRPGTKFEVVRAERPEYSRFRNDDDQGVIEVYLREIEPSTVTTEQVKGGLAGKIPTEAKVAGGLLALGGAEALTDDDDESGAPLEAGVGVGALALLFGGRGKARLFNEQRILLGKKLPAAARAVADEYIERNAGSIEKVVRWATTADRGPLQRAVMSLRNEIVDNAVAAESAIQALKGNADAQTALDRYVKTSIEAKLADAARHLPLPPARNTRKNVGALLEAEANAVDLVDSPLHRRYSDTRVKGIEARFEKSWNGLQKQLQNEVHPGLDDLARDYEATNRLAEISNAIDEALGRFDPSHKTDWKPGPAHNLAEDDRLMRAAAGDNTVDLDKLEVDMFEAARDNIESRTGRSPSGLSRTPGLGDFIEQRVDWAIASAAEKAREKAAKDPIPGLKGRGLAIRHGGVDFFNESWAEDVRFAAKSQHTNPERWRDIKARAIQRLNSYQVDLPKGQATAIVDDLIDAAVNGDDIERAVEDIARLANEGAEGARVGQHRRLAETFKRFTETASHDLGFDVDRAIADYAGDFDYKHINKYVRTGDVFGSKDDLDALEAAAEAALETGPDSHRAARIDEITRKAERLQVALDYAVVHGYTAPGKTWRGVLMTNDELLALQTSDVAEAKSFMSTSADADYPLQFISGKHQLNKDPSLNKVIFEVRQRTGVPVNPGESEILLRAGSRFRVERIDDAETRATFRLTEIDADHAYAPSELGNRIGNRALPWVAGGALLLGAATDDDDSGAVGAGVGLGGLALLMGRNGGKLLLRGTEHDVAQGAARLAAAAKDIADPRLQAIRAATDAAFDTFTPGERNAMDLYTQSSRHVKDALEAEQRGTLSARQGIILDDFTSAMKKLEQPNPAAAAPIIRGVDLTDDQIAKLVESNEVQLSNFSSATFFPAKAAEFAGGVPYEWRRFGKPLGARGRARQTEGPTTPVLFVFDQVDRASPKFPSARHIKHPAIDSESEVVLPPGGIFEPTHVAAQRMQVGTKADPFEVDGLRIHLKQVGEEAPPAISRYSPEAAQLRETDEFEILARDAPDGMSVKDYFERHHEDPRRIYEVRGNFRRLEQAGLITLEKRGDDLWARAVPPTETRVKPGRFLLSLGLGLGVGAKTLLDSSEASAAEDVDPETARIISEAEAAREAREQQLEETRQKLGYLAHQSRQALATAARALASPEKLDRKVESVPGVTHSAGVARFLGGNSNLREAFESRREMLKQIERDPMTMVDDLAEGFAELADNAPELHAEVVAQTYKVASFLQSKLPGTVGASLVRPDGTPPSSMAIRQFALYYSAATDPSSVIEDVTNNRVRKEQVDTLRELWPDTYSKLKVAVVEQMARSRPTVSQRMRMDLLFDFGENLDRALAPGLVATYQAARAAKMGQGEPPAAAPKRRSNPSVGGTGALGSLALGPAAGQAMG